MTMEDSLQPSAATEELYHTNLLRLQATQLLSESILPLSSHTGMLENEVKWAKDVWEYVDNIKRSLSTIGEAVISPDDVKFNSGKSEKQKFWIKLHSDKAQKHLKSEDEKDKWNFPFPGGEHLKVAPIYSYAANGAGLTTSVANANVLPTIDLAVLMPVMSKFDDDNEEDNFGMIGGKDYLNGRYFDVSYFFSFRSLIALKSNGTISYNFYLRLSSACHSCRKETFLQSTLLGSSLRRNKGRKSDQCMWYMNWMAIVEKLR